MQKDSAQAKISSRVVGGYFLTHPVVLSRRLRATIDADVDVWMASNRLQLNQEKTRSSIVVV